MNPSLAYDKWHETELERWLSDHNVPYPTPSYRKDLENLVKDNWNAYVIQPYNSWDTNQLQKWLNAQRPNKAAVEKDNLVQQVQATWSETADSADKAYADVKDWIFDSYAPLLIASFRHTNQPYAAGRSRSSRHSSIVMVFGTPNQPPRMISWL